MPFSLLKSLKPVAGRALQAALNRALALDTDTRQALSALDGRHIDLTLEAPSLAMRISVHGEQLEVGPVDHREADLAVRSSLSGVLAQLPLIAQSRSAQGSQTGRVRVAGDAELARRLQQLAKGFDPDWQLPFVRVFGEIAGVQIANAFRGALQHARRGASDLAHAAAEFVTEESRDVVPRGELDAFHDDVDVLRDDVERLAARVHRLRGAA